MPSRFDICEAYYVYAMLNHQGQNSRAYKIFGRLARIGFNPSPLLNDEHDLEEPAREIYDRLVSRRY